MAENKTKATKASVKSYLAAIKDESRRKASIAWPTSPGRRSCWHDSASTR
jgi:hypothetical protein